MRRALRRLRCQAIELHNVDATTFRIPPEVTVTYLWNPFSGHVLEKVFANIRRSIEESPPTVTIVHLSPRKPTPLDLLKNDLPWLRECKRVSLGTQSLAVIYTCVAAVLNSLTM